MEYPYVIETTDPGTYTVGEFTLARSGDEFCPHCDEPVRFEMGWDDTDPEEGEEFRAECWACREIFRVSYEYRRSYTARSADDGE